MLTFLGEDEVKALDTVMAAREPKRICHGCRDYFTEAYFSMCGKPFRSYKASSAELKLTCNSCLTKAPEGTGFFFESPKWMKQATCSEVDTETAKLFFPENNEKINAQAWSSICVECPVRAKCAEWGETTDGEGVFGGEFRTFRQLDPSKPDEYETTTVGGRQPGWLLLHRGECRKGHPVLTTADILVRYKKRNGVVRTEGECYHCYKVTRNKTQARRRKESRSNGV